MPTAAADGAPQGLRRRLARDTSGAAADLERGTPRADRRTPSAEYLLFQRRVFGFYVCLMAVGGFVMIVLLFQTPLTNIVVAERSFIRLTVLPLYAVIFGMLMIFRNDYKVLTFVMHLVIATLAFTMGVVSVITFKDVAYAALLLEKAPGG